MSEISQASNNNQNIMTSCLYRQSILQSLDCHDEIERTYEVFIGIPSSYRTAHRDYIKQHKEYANYIHDLYISIIHDTLDHVYSEYAKDITSYSQSMKDLRFKCYCEKEMDNDSDIDKSDTHYEHIRMKRVINLVYEKVIDLMNIWKNIVMVVMRSDIKERQRRNNSICLDGVDPNSLYDYIHADTYDDAINEMRLSVKRIKPLTEFLVSKIVFSTTPDHPMLILGMEIGGCYIVDSAICESKSCIVLEVRRSDSGKTDDFDEEQFAMKMNLIGTKSSLTIRKEATIISRFPSLPYLPTYKGFGIYVDGDKHHNFLVTPLYGSDLYEMIVDNPIYNSGSGMGIDSTRRMTWQLIQALRYLHKQNIMHNDIKPENIVFKDPVINIDASTDSIFDLTETKSGPSNPYLNIVLIDYGLSQDVTIDYEHDKIQGTVSYLSPEELSGNQASLQADIWALGVVILEIYHGYSIFKFDIMENIGTIEAICDYSFTDISVNVCTRQELVDSRNAYLRMNRTDYMKHPIDKHYLKRTIKDELLHDLIKGCLDPIKDMRYTAEQLYYHPFLKRYRDLEIESDVAHVTDDIKKVYI